MKLDTTTLLLLAAGAFAVYEFTKPKVTAGINPYTGLPYTYGTTGLPTTALNNVNPYLNQNPTGGILTGAGSALEGLSDLIGNFF